MVVVVLLDQLSGAFLFQHFRPGIFKMLVLLFLRSRLLILLFSRSHQHLLDSRSLYSSLVRSESAMTFRALDEIDTTCVGGLVNYGITTLKALRENVSFGKRNNLKVELDSLSGQATILAALASVSPKLPLGYPARFPRTMFDVARKILTESSQNTVFATVEKQVGWLLLLSLRAALEATKSTLIQDSIKLLLDFRVGFDQELGLILKLRYMMIGWIHEGFQSFFRQLNDKLLKHEGAPL
ncbi:unnamed protein product [Lactuca saligna]|uniref:Uncharacterized protein n=1 Tax=Lactuca saligna TaxID=75948 RepID=A0AA35ZTX0_LACSI|nr:unnamed protein product [Lactuca saligna]